MNTEETEGLLFAPPPKPPRLAQLNTKFDKSNNALVETNSGQMYISRVGFEDVQQDDAEKGAHAIIVRACASRPALVVDVGIQRKKIPKIGIGSGRETGAVGHVADIDYLSNTNGSLTKEGSNPHRATMSSTKPTDFNLNPFNQSLVSPVSGGGQCATRDDSSCDVDNDRKTKAQFRFNNGVPQVEVDTIDDMGNHIERLYISQQNDSTISFIDEFD